MKFDISKQSQSCKKKWLWKMSQNSKENNCGMFQNRFCIGYLQTEAFVKSFIFLIWNLRSIHRFFHEADPYWGFLIEFLNEFFESFCFTALLTKESTVAFCKTGQLPHALSISNPCTLQARIELKLKLNTCNGDM